MYDFPVAESPIRQSGCPFLIHSQLASVWMVAGSMFELRRSRTPAALLPREARRLDPALRSPPGPVVALGHQQLGQEPAAGHLFLHRPVGDVGKLVADVREPQHAAGGVNGRGGRPARSGRAGGAGSLGFSLSVVTAAGATASKQLVMGR